jgi:site-specific recombinase XerC
VVYLSEACVQALERYLAGQAAGSEAPLLCHPTGQEVSYRWVQKQVRQWGEEAGVAVCHHIVYAIPSPRG